MEERREYDERDREDPRRPRRLLMKPTDYLVAVIAVPVAVVCILPLAIVYGAFLGWGIVHYTIKRWV